MTEREIEALLAQYRVGLDAELVLLHRLQDVAAHQQATSHASDIEALQHAADERDALMSGLMAIEQDLKGVRDRLSESQAAARRVPGFSQVAALHRQAAAIVEDILDTDRDSLRALAQVVRARQVAAQALEQGEATLAAYGRVTAPPPAATLVSRRG